MKQLVRRKPQFPKREDDGCLDVGDFSHVGDFGDFAMWAIRKGCR
jgi:hypothetical protein